MKYPLDVGIGDAGILASLQAVATLPPFQTPPVRGSVDDLPLTDLPGWVAALGEIQRDGAAKWFGGSAESYQATKLVATSRQSSRVTFSLPEAFDSVTEALAWIEQLPFGVCSLGTVFLEEWLAMDADTFGFGQGHYAHGWACAFRGKGHDRLVSRRWLEFGPWRLVRGSGDLSLVQFHELGIGPEAAYEQACPGHERMGVSSMGGYLQVPYFFTQEVEGLYDATRRTLEIIVPPGGVVDQVRMRDACALRYQHRVEPPAADPVEQVAYVFVDELDARAHLHELWLRELEVWLVDGDGKRRLDLSYQPSPLRPSWVKALQSAENDDERPSGCRSP
jgi:hypothetical protein